MSTPVRAPDSTPLATPQSIAAPKAATSYTIGILVFLTLGLAGPLLVLLNTQPLSTPSWLHAIPVWLGALGYASVAGTGRREPYALTFWLFYYLFLGLAPFVQARLERDPSTTPGIDHSLDTASVAVIVLFGVTFMLGYHATGRVRDRSLAPLQGEPVALHRLRLATGLAVVLCLFYLSRVGVGPFLSSREGLDQARLAALGESSLQALISALGTIPLGVCVIAWIVVARQSSVSQARRTARLTLVMLTPLFLVVVNPISSPRYVFGTVLLAVVSALGAFDTRRRARILAVALVMGMLVVFPYADLARRQNQSGGGSSTGPLAVLVSGDFDAAAQVSNTVAYVNLHGITWGRQATGPLLFLVPRTLWPDKPEDTGVLLAKSRGYGFTNLSAPLPAELFINFGWAGLFVGGLTLGRLCLRGDTRTRRGGREPVLHHILPFYAIILYRGSLLQATAILVTLAGTAIFVDRGSARRHESIPE